MSAKKGARTGCALCSCQDGETSQACQDAEGEKKAEPTGAVVPREGEALGPSSSLPLSLCDFTSWLEVKMPNFAQLEQVDGAV